MFEDCKKQIQTYLLVVKELGLGYLLVCTCGNFLAPILVAANIDNNVDLGNHYLVAQHDQNEGQESD